MKLFVLTTKNSNFQNSTKTLKYHPNENECLSTLSNPKPFLEKTKN